MIDSIARVGDVAALQPSAMTPSRTSGFEDGLGGTSMAPADIARGYSIGGLVDDVSRQLSGADQEIRKLAVGEADSIHHVLIALQDAKVSLGLMVQVRNRMVDAYQELLRMQI